MKTDSRQIHPLRLAGSVSQSQRRHQARLASHLLLSIFVLTSCFPLMPSIAAASFSRPVSIRWPAYVVLLKEFLTHDRTSLRTYAVVLLMLMLGPSWRVCGGPLPNRLGHRVTHALALTNSPQSPRSPDPAR